jgi:hypothetical protein
MAITDAFDAAKAARAMCFIALQCLWLGGSLHSLGSPKNNTKNEPL